MPYNLLLLICELVFLIIGDVLLCSKETFVLFGSHSHGKNELSSADGSSILIDFSCLDDLVTYSYFSAHRS